MAQDFQHTVDEGKHMLRLVQRYAKLELTDKMSAIITMLVLIVLVSIFSIVALFFIGMFVVTELNTLLNNMALSYAITGVALLLLCILIVLLRKAIIERPVTKQMKSMFFQDEHLNADIKVEKLKTQYEMLLTKERVQQSANRFVGNSGSIQSHAGYMRYISYGITAWHAYRSIRQIVKQFRRKR